MTSSKTALRSTSCWDSFIFNFFFIHNDANVDFLNSGHLCSLEPGEANVADYHP